MMNAPAKKSLFLLVVFSLLAFPSTTHSDETASAEPRYEPIEEIEFVFPETDLRGWTHWYADWRGRHWLEYEEYVGKRGKIIGRLVTQSKWGQSYCYIATVESGQKVYERASVKEGPEH